MTRAIIIAASIAALFCIWLDQPPPAKVSEVPYCVVTYKAGAKDPFGNWHTAWVQGYGPCSLQDEYRNI